MFNERYSRMDFHRRPIPSLCLTTVRNSSMAVALLVVIAVAGCGEQAKKRLARKVTSQALSQLKVDRGFHIIEGKAVFLDSNTSVGRIEQELPDADVSTFRALNQPSDARALFAVDSKGVFMGELYRAIRLDNVDGASFEMLTPDGEFSKDSDRVYYVGVEIEGTDPKSFELLEYPFGKDDNHAYIGTIRIPVEDLESWEPLQRGKASDPWHRSSRGRNPRPQNELMAFGWSKDSKRLYYGGEVVNEADADSFELLSRYYGRDKRHVYHSYDIVEKADPTTFVVHDGPYLGNTGIHAGAGPDAHDARHQFRSGRLWKKK